MTIFTHDWEFLEDGETIKPISCAFVSETGDSIYAVFPEYKKLCGSKEWLVNNVLPHLDDNCVIPVETIKKDIRDFIRSFPDPELWAYYGAYDHVAMAQTLGGPMICLPSGIPMFTNDIKTLELIARESTVETVQKSMENTTPIQDISTEHHALYDAMHDMELIHHYRNWFPF